MHSNKTLSAELSQLKKRFAQRGNKFNCKFPPEEQGMQKMTGGGLFKDRSAGEPVEQPIEM